MSADPDYDEGVSRRNLRQRPQRKTVESIDDGPDYGSKRKQKKKNTFYGKSIAYDECGNIKHNGLDVCDCMNDACEGCWYECRSCGSTRCGPQCRVYRKFFYESISHDGKEAVIYNSHFPGKC